MTEAPPAKPRRGLAITSLVLGILGLPTLGLVGIGALAGIALGVIALVNASRHPAEYAGRGFAIAGIALSVLSVAVMPFVLGIVAAIAIPSLLRARVAANESAAIADIRTVLSAESEYLAASGGYYGPLECLAMPRSCLPSYAGPALVDGALLDTGARRGYTRSFHGEAAAGLPAGVPASSLRAYAYVAVPENQGRTGVRSFCGDSTGRICTIVDGSIPEVVGGLCPAGDCKDLR